MEFKIDHEVECIEFVSKLSVNGYLRLANHQSFMK